MGEPVLGPLVEYLGSGLWYTRASAVTALGRMGNPRAAAPLVGMLNDPNRTVRDAVWDALLALCRNELATRELAQAFDALPERARRFALDGLLERDAEAAGQVVLYMEEPAQAREIPAPEPREGTSAPGDFSGATGGMVHQIARRPAHRDNARSVSWHRKFRHRRPALRHQKIYRLRNR